MKSSACIFLFLVILPLTVYAQELSDTDLSRYEIIEQDDEYPTVESVEVLRENYFSALEKEGCETALPKIVAFHEKANLLSNIIRRGNEPYYDARRDDQKKIAMNSELLKELVAAESSFNDLIEKRNEAWVTEARCLQDVGDRNGAISRLMRALDHISGREETRLWAEARLMLWELVGFKTLQ